MPSHLEMPGGSLETKRSMIGLGIWGIRGLGHGVERQWISTFPLERGPIVCLFVCLLFPFGITREQGEATQSMVSLVER